MLNTRTTCRIAYRDKSATLINIIYCILGADGSSVAFRCVCIDTKQRIYLIVSVYMCVFVCIYMPLNYSNLSANLSPPSIKLCNLPPSGGQRKWR